jgi:glycosyltransferase involved in cell wall biosynthesis
MQRSPRVFVGYHEVAGYCAGISDALRRCGVSTHFCSTTTNRYYDPPRGTCIERLMRRRIPVFSRSGRPVRIGRRIERLVLRCLLFFEMLARYDSFVLVDTYSPLGAWDRKLLKLAGKKVVSVFLGSDSRPYYLNGFFCDKYAGDFAGMARAIWKQYDEVRRIERYSDLVVCHELSSHYLSRPYARFLAIGFPLDRKRLPAAWAVHPAGAPRKVVVLHAPSAPRFKGTDLIVEAVDELRNEGLDIELRMICGLPNVEVLKEVGACDFVIDEAFSDSPLAGFAVEAAALGKPAIVGSYAREADFSEARMPPSLLVEPGAIKEAIRKLAIDETLREKIGSAAKEFIETTWSATEVGRRFERILTGSCEASWLSDPGGNTYIHGWGIGEKALGAYLRGFISSQGIEALRLDDKLSLRTRIASFASPAPCG